MRRQLRSIHATLVSICIALVSLVVSGTARASAPAQGLYTFGGATQYSSIQYNLCLDLSSSATPTTPSYSAGATIYSNICNDSATQYWVLTALSKTAFLIQPGGNTGWCATLSSGNAVVLETCSSSSYTRGVAPFLSVPPTAA